MLPSAQNIPQTRPRRWHVLGVAIVAAGVLAAVALGRGVASPDVADTPASKMLDAREVFRVAPMHLTTSLALSGDIRPLRRVTISAEVGGIAGDVGPRAAMMSWQARFF